MCDREDAINQESVTCVVCDDGCDFGDTVNGQCEKCQPIDHTIGTDVEALKRHIEESKVFVATHYSFGGHGKDIIGIYRTRSAASIAIIRAAGAFEESFGWYEIDTHILNHTPVSNVGR